MYVEKPKGGGAAGRDYQIAHSLVGTGASGARSMGVSAMGGTGCLVTLVLRSLVFLAGCALGSVLPSTSSERGICKVRVRARVRARVRVMVRARVRARLGLG